LESQAGLLESRITRLERSYARLDSLFFRSTGHGEGPPVSAHLQVSTSGICASAAYCESLPPLPRVKPVIGKAYEVAPNWYVVLKSAKRAIIVQRTVLANEDYRRNARDIWGRVPKEYIYFLTARKGSGLDDMHVHYTMEQAIKDAQWAPWPDVWTVAQSRGYTTLFEAAETLANAVPDDVPINYLLLIRLLGHAGAFRVHYPEKPGRNEAYWAAAAKVKPDMSEVTVHLTDNPYWREWAIRLGAVHGRPVSSMERVTLCTSEQQTMREFALTASSGEPEPHEEAPERAAPAPRRAPI